MEMQLQFGYGMMDHCRSLIQEWSGSTVILSPRDLTPTQLGSLSKDIRAANGTVYLDPQFYLPYADHERLVSHDFWPKGYESSAFWTGPELDQLLGRVVTLNRELGCSRIVLPGLFAQIADEDWIVHQKEVLDAADRIDLDPSSLLLTVALASDAVRSVEQVHEILDAAANWPVGGIYLVCEHPNGDYLVEDAIWLANVLDMTAGFRLQGKTVVLGYCNHQMLIAACASATAIATGTWMNVRSFPPEKFRTQYDDEIKKRSKWYYCLNWAATTPTSFFAEFSQVRSRSLNKRRFDTICTHFTAKHAWRVKQRSMQRSLGTRPHWIEPRASWASSIRLAFEDSVETFTSASMRIEPLYQYCKQTAARCCVAAGTRFRPLPRAW